MKKLLLLLATVTAIFTACKSGGDVEEENGGTPFIPEITISPKDLNFSCNGGEQKVDITANFEYEVAERASWITIEQTDEGLLVIVDANKNTSERSTYISITNSQYDINKNIEIYQEAWVPKIELAEQSVEAEFEPAQYTVDVTSPYSWEATSKNDWIVVDTEDGIAGTETLKFSVLRNEEEQERKGTITLKNTDYNLVAELYVTQKAFVPEITIEPESLTFATEGGEQEVAVTANFEYEFSTEADWITIEKSEKGVKVTVPNYVEVENRTADITISNEKYSIAKVVKVTQGAFVPEITIEPESLTFATEGGEQEVAVTANFEYEFSTEADWITIEKSEKGVKVTVPNYVEVENRTADITISNEKYSIAKVVKVTQGAFVPEITIEPESLTFATEGGEQEVAVTANFEYEFSTEADWITIEKSKNGVNITATLNAELEERTAEVAILSEKYGISKVITVTQGAFVPEITVGVESLTFATEGGEQEVTVTSNFEYEWSTNADWLTIEKSKNGVNITATINAELEERTAEVAILSEKYGISKVVTVTQGAFVPEITVGVESLTFATEGGEQEVTVTSNFEYEFSTNADWLTIEKSKNGVNITATINAELEERTAEVAILSEKYGIAKVVKVTQGAFVPEITVGVESLTFEFEKSTQEVTITSNFEYEFSTNADWLTIEKSKNGVNITATLNTEFEERAAEITISNEKYGISKTILVIQNGVSVESNQILYTSSNNKIVTPYNSNAFGANIVSNTYENGQGVITFAAPVTSIGEKAFRYCDSLTSVTIPDSVTSIGNAAFCECYSLTSVTIPDSVTSIGEDAFYKCSSLTSVTIPNSVTSIGEDAFYKCSSLTSVTIGNSVTSIGDSAFSDCTSLTSVTIPDSVTSIGMSAFWGCHSLTSITIPDSVTSIGEYTFAYCNSLTSVTIPDSVTSIGYAAFGWCDSLTSITIPDSVTSIGKNAFYDCTSLTSVTIGNSVTSIGNSAFYGCDSLISVTIPDSVTSIGEDAFRGCKSLTSITIGNGVTSIGYSAFRDCTSLTSVYCKAITPPAGDLYMFDNNASGRKIYVPRNSVSAYKAASVVWISYASYIKGYDF